MGKQLDGGVAVKIGRALYDKIKDYAVLNNKNVQQVVNSGLFFWYETWAETETEHNFEKMAMSVAEHAEEPVFISSPNNYPAKHPS